MIRIVTESMSDFTQEEAKAADLIVMPLPIRFGMEEYWDDGVSLTQDVFYMGGKHDSHRHRIHVRFYAGGSQGR